ARALLPDGRLFRMHRQAGRTRQCAGLPDAGARWNGDMPASARIEPAADLVVIGAGPAGMAAAVEARRYGLAVTVLDDQPAAGGQILRGITRPHRVHYERWGQPLADAFATCGARHVAGAAVWARDGDTLVFGRDG